MDDSSGMKVTHSLETKHKFYFQHIKLNLMINIIVPTVELKSSIYFDLNEPIYSAKKRFSFINLRLDARNYYTICYYGLFLFK